MFISYFICTSVPVVITVIGISPQVPGAIVPSSTTSNFPSVLVTGKSIWPSVATIPSFNSNLHAATGACAVPLSLLEYFAHANIANPDAADNVIISNIIRIMVDLFLRLTSFTSFWISSISITISLLFFIHLYFYIPILIIIILWI